MLDILRRLKKEGIKSTPQRIAICDYLLNTKEHPGAETIHNALKSQYPAMSLATVYKTLAAFKKAGLIRELSDRTCGTRYDGNTATHHHIVCLSCNKVEDISMDIPFGDGLLQEISKETGYRTEFQRLYFYGYCMNCSNKD